MKRFITRHRLLVAVATVATVALVAAVLVGTGGLDSGPAGGRAGDSEARAGDVAVPADTQTAPAASPTGSYSPVDTPTGLDAAAVLADPAGSAQVWLAGYLTAQGVTNVETRPVRVESDAGGTHVRLAQTVSGVDVWTREANVHFSPDGGTVTGVESGFDTTPAALASTAPVVTAADAAASAVAAAGGGDVAMAKLTVLAGGTYPEVGADRLVWMHEVARDSRRIRVAVDADDGSVVVRRDVTQTETANDRVRYTYRDYPWDLLGEQKGWLQYTETAKVAPWYMPPTAQVTNAHTYTGQTYDYYKNTFGRISYDGMGARMDAVAEMPTAVIGSNAFWNGSWTAFTSGMVTKDIVGHEWTHAVSQASAGLDYVNASGAVNEAHSDIFGSMMDRDDWELGEGSALGVIRSMEDPEAYDQPANIDDALVYVPLCMDNGGVHINSGIINHAFYLLATALDKERAEQIAYRALTRHMVPSTNFTQTRMAYLAAADDLYGAASAEYAAVETAFAGAGITASTVEPYFNCWYSIPPDDEMWGPYPEIVASQRTGVAPLSVDFEALSRTVEEQGGEILFDWDFGDGATASGGAVSHTFTDPGTYIVEVTALHDTEFTDPSTASYTLPISVYEKKSKVMAIAFDPILGTRGSARMTDYLSWRDPAELTAQMAEDMGAAAGIAYEVAETHTVGEFPEFEDGYTYPEADYLKYVMGRGGAAHAGTTDYSAIMDRFDVCDKVANDNISEVWLIGGPDFGFEDWALKIPGDAVPHTPSDPAFYPSYDLPDCGSTYTVMGWSVQSDPSELGFSSDNVLVDALDAVAMRAAGVLSLTVGQGEWYDADPSNPWRAFSLYERDYPGEAGVGGPRNPPNAPVEGDYFTGHTPGASVTSTADDWYDYPATTGATQTLDCYTWACDGVGYLRWYLAHIPRAAGTSMIGGEPFSNNWWDYIVDYDGRLDATSTVPNAAPTAALSATPLTGSAPLLVDFDAGASTDTDGSVVSYEWDYDGDGTVDATTGTATSDNTYSSSGTYWPRVTVVDDDGGRSSVDAGPVTLAAPIPPDEVSVTISGGINYTASGPLTSGDVNVNPAGTGTISSVTGSGTIPGPNSGTATVTFAVSRVSWAGSYNGSVRVSDPTNGVSLTTSLFFKPVGRNAGQADTAKASYSGSVWVGGQLKSYSITWTVKDNT